MTTQLIDPAGAPTGLVRVKGSRPSVQTLRSLLRDPLGCASLIWLMLLAVLVFAAPILPLANPIEGSLSDALQLPSLEHPLGTDTLGRDILSRLLYGGQPALAGAALAVAVAVLLGGTLGLIAGYVGGWFAALTSRLADLIFSMPAIVVLLALAAVWGRSTAVAMLSFGVLLSATFIRLLQSSTHAARRERYVDAAITMGTSTPRILMRHLLPNVAGPVIVQLSLAFGTALLVQASLGFLGLGPEPPAPDWGGMIAEASSHLYLQPWLLVPTGVVLALAILSANLLGDALRGQELDRRKPSALRLATAEPDRPLDHKPEDTAMITVDGLSVSYEQGPGAHCVVKDVSLSINRGEILAVVGESGSGKTTLGLAALGLLPHPARVVAGDIRIDGVGSIVDRTQRELQAIRGADVGMIFQEPMVALDPCYTVKDQLTRPIRRHRGVARGESVRIARELLLHVGIPDPDRVLRLYPHEMSGGMAQRVCIALALAGKPRVLVADEPTTALDVTVQAGILDLLRRLAQDDGLAVLLVTHDLGVVADVADRIVVMQNGAVVETNDTVALFASPNHPYTRQLIASTPNILEEAADYARR